MGYAYLNSYFAHFGVTLHEIGPSIQDILAFSAIVLMAAAKPILIIFGLVCFAYFFALRELRIAGIKKFKGKGLTVPSVGVAFMIGVAGLAFATSHGKEVAKGSVREALRSSLWVEASQSTEKLLSEVVNPSFGARLHLLYATERMLFILVTYRDLEGFTVIRIPRSDVLNFGVMME
jgi:hypothetical protein